MAKATSITTTKRAKTPQKSEVSSGQSVAAQRLSLEEKKLEHRTRLALADSRAKVLRFLIGTTAVVLCFYFMYASIASLAGKETSVTAVAKAAADFSVNEWLAWTVAGVVSIAWGNERRLKRRIITEHGNYIKSLETRLAPERQSSGLLPDGRQKERDKDA